MVFEITWKPHSLPLQASYKQAVGRYRQIMRCALWRKMTQKYIKQFTEIHTSTSMYKWIAFCIYIAIYFSPYAVAKDNMNMMFTDPVYEEFMSS